MDPDPSSHGFERRRRYFLVASLYLSVELGWEHIYLYHFIPTIVSLYIFSFFQTCVDIFMYTDMCVCAALLKVLTQFFSDNSTNVFSASG